MKKLPILRLESVRPGILTVFVMPMLVCSPDIVFNIINKTLVQELWGILFTYAILLLPLYIFRNYLRAYFFVPAAFVLLAPFAIFPILYFGTIPDINILMLVYNTTYEEASELLKPYAVDLIIVTVLNLCVLVVLYRLMPRRISRQRGGIISVVSLFILLGMPLVRSGRVKNYSAQLKATLYSYYPFYLGYYGHELYQDIQKIDQYTANVAHFEFHARERDSLPGRQIFILVIGESSRYDHWGINHYYRNTSPNLSHLPRLLSFNKVISGGGFTELAVPIIITRATARNFDIQWREKSIVSLFKEAGFDTYWITDQTDLGNILIHVHEADHQILMQSSSTARKHIHRDMELADTLKKIIGNGERKMFVVVHTMGSHNNYTDRYPPKFDVFKPSGKGSIVKFTDPANKNELINGYDNSILYSDAVLADIIHSLNASRSTSAMLYVSDHGENLFDDSRKLILHPPGIITRYVAHVPLFIYTTAEYDSAYKAKVSDLKSHINDKASSSDIFSTLCGLADITFPHWDSTKSLANKSFISRPRYILAGINKLFRYSHIKTPVFASIN